ncbi:hypothetical protein K3U93_07915 [Mycobacterium malmoense]|nr:hypothetical protein [Mycobacterium malmoense]QZA19046.1 hypothetical protein K3U93_07915 [Mycobacterium malmoense]UNB95810.1 hypothetical protein H5T25_07905 [Mycobacterium malmoense]
MLPDGLDADIHAVDPLVHVLKTFVTVEVTNQRRVCRIRIIDVRVDN